jgi:hypothetical protein
MLIIPTQALILAALTSYFFVILSTNILSYINADIGISLQLDQKSSILIQCRSKHCELMGVGWEDTRVDLELHVDWKIV